MNDCLIEVMIRDPKRGGSMIGFATVDGRHIRHIEPVPRSWGGDLTCADIHMDTGQVVYASVSYDRIKSEWNDVLNREKWSEAGRLKAQLSEAKRLLGELLDGLDEYWEVNDGKISADEARAFLEGE